MLKHSLRICALLAITGHMSVSHTLAAPPAAPAAPPMQARPDAYPNPNVSLSPAALRGFDTALPWLARQAHVAFVCEGQPLRLSLSDTQAQALSLRFSPSGLPLEQAVQHIAAAYDYDAVRTGAGTFLLIKRYTDADDLPDVTFGEINGSLLNILQATQTFVPAITKTNAVLQILRSASDEQRQRLAQGITISELPNEWRQAAWQFVCSFRFGPLDNVKRVSNRLQACRSRKTEFRYKQFWNLTLPIYQGPFAAGGMLDAVVLSSWLDTGSGGGTTLELTRDVKFVDEKRVISESGIADPTTPRPAAKIPPPSTSTLWLSLADEAERLNARLVPGGNGLSAVKVDQALAAKGVCIAGEEFASPETLLKAVADVYGLEVRRDGGTARITLPRPRVVDDPRNVPDEVRRLLPAPFVRATKSADPQNPEGAYSSERASRLYIAAIRRLREIIEPELQKRPDKRLPVPDASDEARDLVALSSLATCVSDLQTMTKPVPSYILDFDKDTLRLSARKDNPNSVQYDIKSLDAQGKGSMVGGEIGFPPGTLDGDAN